MSEHDHTISFAQANIIGTAIGFAGAAVVVLAYAAVHGFGGFSAVGDAFEEHLAVLVVVVLTSVVVHEALHGVGFCYLGGVPRSSVRFGVNWKLLTPFAGTSATMPAAGYRWAVMLPALVLGVAPSLYGVISGSALFAAFGAFMVAAAGGDAAALWAMRTVPATAIVRDAQARVGCEVVANGADATTSESQ